MEDLFQKFKKQFIEEIFGLLQSLETDLLSLEKNPEDSQVIDSVFRAMHTIKGTSAMYGCQHISNFTHHLENIFQTIRDTKAQVDKSIIDISLESLDHIKCLMEDQDFKDSNNITRNEELISEISKYSVIEKVNTLEAIETNPSHVQETKEKQTWYILLRTDEQIYTRGVSLVNILTDLANLGTYHIHRIPALSDKEVETWGIILISTFGINDIREVFMFIEDYCSFVLIKEGDLQNEDDIQKFAAMQQFSTASPTRVIKQIVNENLPELEEQKVTAENIQLIQPTVNSKTSILLAEAAKLTMNRISVDSAKLDYLMYLVSELISLNSKLLQTTKDDYYENIRPQIEQMESLAKLFRSNALEIRLVPLGDMVLKFQRLVRDLAKQLDKKIEFTTQGTDTELDKNTIDLIVEPLIHIIRNAIDHGIETPPERLKKGKPETGNINLSARNVGNYIHISIEDDGAGLDLEKIKEKAIKKGLIKESDKLSKTEICNLIFHSGFSTSEQITNISGRGVGMDVVRRKITELRGEIQIETEKDIGTTFVLKLQQSIAIIDTLLFRVQKTYFILPLTDIEICIHADKSEIIRNQNTGTIDYNEKMIPFLDLRAYFNLGGNYPNPVKMLILKERGQSIGLLCDEILGEQQAVLKPLGQSFDNQSGIIAVSQHGNGEWAYMLNAHFLHQMLKKFSTQNRNNHIIA